MLAHRLFLVSSVQITDGQQDPKNSWKHFPLSLEAGWAVSSIHWRFRFLILIIGYLLVSTTCFQLLDTWLQDRNTSTPIWRRRLILEVINQTSDETASQSLWQGQTISSEVLFRRSKTWKRLWDYISIQESVTFRCSAQQIYVMTIHCLCWP